MTDNSEIQINMNNMSEFFEWFFITSTAISKDGMTVDEFVNKVVSNGVVNSEGNLDGTHRIRMFVNDIEVNPLEAISELQKQFDEVVERRAKELFNEMIDNKFNDVIDNLDLLKNNIKENINNNFNK